MTERELERAWADLCGKYEIRRYHPPRIYPPRKSRRGWPDEVAWFPRGGLLLAELKGDGGRASRQQLRTLAELDSVASFHGCRIFRPAHLVDGTIERELRALREAPVP